MKILKQKYAELIVKTGLNVQKDQIVFITAGLDQPDFVAMVTEECYKAGAKEVIIDWTFDPISKIKAQYETLETMSKVPEYIIEKWRYKSNNLACRLFIDSDDPDAMKGLTEEQHEKIAKADQLMWPVIKPFRDAMENKHQWCIAAVPGKKWAEKVFPDLDPEDAETSLWMNIFKACKVLSKAYDPIQAWKYHNENLKKRCEWLNNMDLEYLHFKNSKGTDFKVWLNYQKSIFCGGSERTEGSNIEFNPNLPSEEVFTTPQAGKAEGIVYATKPLSYMGELIENFWLRFEDGKVVSLYAEKNQHLLEKMIDMDEGAKMLGEVALIPESSPINQMDTLFYNTLFDENASCHLALGRGFDICYKDFEKYSSEELHKLGVNDSMIHVDFMIGSDDMEINGYNKSGYKIEIFKNGEWA